MKKSAIFKYCAISKGQTGEMRARGGLRAEEEERSNERRREEGEECVGACPGAGGGVMIGGLDLSPDSNLSIYCHNTAHLTQERPGLIYVCVKFRESETDRNTASI